MYRIMGKQLSLPLKFLAAGTGLCVAYTLSWF